MIVVSDSSPVISLARIDCLHLLNRLYARVFIPIEVYNELVIVGAGLPGADQAVKAEWIEVRPVKDLLTLDDAVLHTGLGNGEVGTVLLARELSADLVLIDERRARRYAISQSLNVMGCVGVLEILYRRGEIKDLRDAYHRLLSQKVRVEFGMLQASLAKFSLPPL